MIQAPPSLPESSGPLTFDDWTELQAAFARCKSVRKAGRIAAFNAWTAAVLAVISGLVAVLDPWSIVFAGVLAVISWNEFRGRRMLKNFDLRGPRVLGGNQLLFITLVVAYGVWKIIEVQLAPNPYAGQLDALASNPEFQKTVTRLGDMNTVITTAVYAILIVAVITVQGLNALYYMGRRKVLREHLEITPTWIIELQKMVQ